LALAVGSYNRDFFRWCGVPEKRIGFAPHAIDTRRFADPEGTHARRAVEWRRELRIPTEARTVVFAGKFQAKKDPLLLLEAFLRCGAAGHLVFVGNGALEAELVARAGGRGDVHFLPFQNQRTMPAVYRLSDVFVLPSRGPGETWGLALNEAMASGRPVIAGSKVGGARDLITPGVNGWIFKSGDLEQLTAIMANVLTGTEAMLSTMGAAAEAESARWSIDAAAKGIAEAAITLHERHTGHR